MTDDAEQQAERSPPPETSPKPKRVMTPAQQAALAKGQAALKERRARKAAGGEVLVETSAAEIREAQRPRAPDPEPEAEQEEEEPEDDESDQELEDDDEEDSEEPEVPAPVPRRARSIDDIAQRYVAPDLPSIREVAAQTKIYTPSRDVLPPPEDAPHLLDGVLSDSDGPDDLVGSTDPKSLADLMAMCPTIGDGQYYIEVNRRAPAQFGTVPCKGIQRNIERHMTMTDFVRTYGGGDYELKLYGPPRRGKSFNPTTGKALVKALTHPVKMELSTALYPPNLQYIDDEDDYEEEEDQDMQRFMPREQQASFGGAPFRRPATTADAKVLQVQVEAEERAADRQDAKEREARHREDKAQGSLAPMLDVLRQSHENTMKIVQSAAAETTRLAQESADKAREEKREAEEEAREANRRAELRAEAERNRPTDTVSMMKGLADMVAALNKGDNGAASAAASRALDQAREEIQRLTQSHAAEVQRLTNGHTNDMQRVQDKHASELSRVQGDSRSEMQRIIEQHRTDSERLERQHREEIKAQDERRKENLQHAERRAEDAERKAEQRVKEADERSDRRVTEAREESRRQLEELRAQGQQRLDDERRQHDRDTASLRATHDTRLASQKDMFDNRIATATQEQTRLNVEIDRWRKEAEDNKDLAKQIEKIETTASALGWAPAGASDQPEPPKDWKEMVTRIGSELVTKLPEIVQSAGDTVRSLRGPAAPTPEQVQQAQYEQMVQNSQHTMPRQMAAMPPPLRARDGSTFAAAPQFRFGTEDGAGFVDTSAPLPRPAIDTTPYPQQQAQPMMVVPMQNQPGMVAEPTPPPQAQQMMPMQQQVPVTQAMQAAPPMQPQPQGQAVPAGAVPVIIPTEMILQVTPMLETAFNQGATPASVAAELIPMIGRENLARILQGLKPERVVAELQKAGQSGSPLVRRNGQQFLRDLWAAAGKALGTQ